MPQSRTVKMAADVIRSVKRGSPADRALRAFFEEGRTMPPAERRAISTTVFAYFRWNKWLDPRLKLDDRVARAVEMQRKFDADGAIPGDSRPFTLAVPEWILDEIDFGDGDHGAQRREEWTRSLQSPARPWIRVRPGTAAAIASELGECSQPAPALEIPCPDALRYDGSADLFRSAQFNSGAFEIQDVASQAVGVACAPHPSETWWDACAGEGGKSLHLADLMSNKGLVWCSDRSQRRLVSLKRRFGRAKLFNYRVVAWEGTERLPTRTKFDGILLDAPCSGVGTWRRNPDARWTTIADDVTELAAVQRRMLEAIVGALKPGGKLIYAVCTLTRRETSEVAAAFAAAHEELEPISPDPRSGIQDPITLWPQDTGGNGMFIAAWRKR